MPEIIFLHKTVTQSGLIYSGPCVFGGYQPELDGANDQDLTIYDNTAASGNPVKPKATLDASQLGEKGVRGQAVKCHNGLYVDLGASAGTRKITVYYLPEPLCPNILPGSID